MIHWVPLETKEICVSHKVQSDAVFEFCREEWIGDTELLTNIDI